MKSVAFYKCPTCGSTKEIVHNPERTGNKDPQFPFTVPCGWRGCGDEARRHMDIIGEITIQYRPPIPIPVATRPQDWTEKARKIIWGG